MTGSSRPLRNVLFVMADQPRWDYFACAGHPTLRQELGQSVIVDNKPGAGGNIGAQEVARSTDGHTFLVGPDTMLTINPHLYKRLSFKPTEELVPVTYLARFNQMLVCNPSVGVKNLSDLLALSKKEKLNYASGGAGVSGHMAMEMLLVDTHMEMTHVPYRGPAPAAQDALAGSVPCGFLATPVAGPYVRNGKLRALLVSGTKRTASLPNVPTARKPERRATMPLSSKQCGLPEARRPPTSIGFSARSRGVEQPGRESQAGHIGPRSDCLEAGGGSSTDAHRLQQMGRGQRPHQVAAGLTAEDTKMRNITEHNITEAVISRFESCPDPRLKEVLTSLVTHLHAFVRETRLTESEWMKGIEFLTAAGHITDAKRQEFILLSDTLGVSMLTVAQNHGKEAGATEATVFGPFHVANAPQFADGADISAGAPGEPLFVDCSIHSVDGIPVAGATIDVWQADQDGYYDVQYEGSDELRARGVLRSDAQGRFRFRSVLPVAYPIPTDGPVGRMLVAGGRHPWRPAHVHFMIQAPGYQTLITHVFRADDPYLDSDVVFGVRASLVGRFIPHAAGKGPHGAKVDGPYHTLSFEFVLPRGELSTSPIAEPRIEVA